MSMGHGHTESKRESSPDWLLVISILVVVVAAMLYR
jgi:hypothetical protein